MPFICVDCGDDIIDCGPDGELCKPGAPGDFQKLGEMVLKASSGGIQVKVPIKVLYKDGVDGPIVRIEVVKKPKD